MLNQIRTLTKRDIFVGTSAIALAIATGLLAIAAADALHQPEKDASIEAPQMVFIQPRTMSYRADGDYQRNNYPVDAPMATRRMKRGFEIMKYQVTMTDYQRCIDDGACAHPDSLPHNKAVRQDGQGFVSSRPVVGISYLDAENYAQWLSRKTGQVWKLPTDQQWAFAAASRFVDNALGVSGEAMSNPALRWLQEYEVESIRKNDRDPTVRASGAFGENELGVADMAGNVWEWTGTCHRRVKLDAKNKVIGEVEVCGVYVANGKHRAAISSFIRNPKTGGCSVGVPPDNLGFRLVRDSRWFAPAIEHLRQSI